MNKNIMASEAKNGCDGKGLQQITALVYLHTCTINEDNLSTTILGNLV
jgi:hypothetical protein